MANDTTPADRYLVACKAAATAQGLDPVVEALTGAGIEVDVEQTGGFTMVAVVRGANGVVAIIDDTLDADATEKTYLVGLHLGTAWQDGDEAAGHQNAEGAEALVAAVRDLLPRIA